jgi:hypothetical protein
MKNVNWRILVGVILLAYGVLFLLQSLNVLDVNALPWAVLVGAAGLTFLYVLFTDRNSWWAAIPGIILLSIAVMLLLSSVAPGVMDVAGGAIVLGGIALSFWVVYLMNVQFWWAIIPAGVMTTLAALTVVENTLRTDGGAIFFLGLAVTFGLLAVLPTGNTKMKWPWIPAAALLFMALIISVATSSMLNYFWPVALILGGGYLIYRTLRQRNANG